MENNLGNEKMTKKETAWQAVKFGLFSASAGLIQFASFTILNEVTALPHWACYLPSLILSVLWNFTLNRHFTFMSANNVPVAMLKVALFYLVFTPLSTWWVAYFTGKGVNEYIVEIMTMGINFVTEFLYDKFIVFRGSENTNALAKREKRRRQKHDENK